jgi:hypothetical protein
MALFSIALMVETKKLMKQISTSPVNMNISKFFIYFFNFKLKKINSPKMVGGHRPINTAFSKFSSTKKMYSDMKIKRITTIRVKSSDFLNLLNIIKLFAIIN